MWKFTLGTSANPTHEPYLEFWRELTPKLHIINIIIIIIMSACWMYLKVHHHMVYLGTMWELVGDMKGTV